MRQYLRNDSSFSGVIFLLSLSNIVQVRVNYSAAPNNTSAFSTGLILAETSSAVSAENRLRLFYSAADLLSAGFTATDPAYLAAANYFSASPAPERLYVGLVGSSETPATVFRQILDTNDDLRQRTNVLKDAAGRYATK